MRLDELIQLKGVYADDDILTKYAQHSAYLTQESRVRICIDNKYHYLHKVVLPVEGLIDHKNRNPSDNRRANLRLATGNQNQGNSSKRIDNTSGYKGVHLEKRTNKWVAQISIKGIRTYLGTYLSKELAALAYNKAALSHFGEFANLNNLEERGL